MRGNAIEHLDSDQANTKGGSSREHRAKVFWRVNMPSMMTVVGRVVVIVFHHGLGHKLRLLRRGE